MNSWYFKSCSYLEFILRYFFNSSHIFISFYDIIGNIKKPII
ncbi:hypothetical protein FM106_19715 [Brachybacterium faecium]|nr:hypothetical protein FM106_19715 [Brachybacterium faecium]